MPRETHAGQENGKTIVRFYEDTKLVHIRTYSKRWFAEREAKSWCEYDAEPETQEQIERCCL